MPHQKFSSIWLVTPPITQLNTPYPATAYLSGFLRKQGYYTSQSDLAIEWILKVLSKAGVRHLKKCVLKSKNKSSFAVYFLENFQTYEKCIEPTIRFLQGRDSTLAYQIVTRAYLPEGPRFERTIQDNETLPWAFGSLGLQDQAKFLASLFIDELNDLFQEYVDAHFNLSRYAEKLAASQASFEPILNKLCSTELTWLDSVLEKLVEKRWAQVKPEVVLITAPFPGNVYGAFRIAQKLKKLDKSIITVLGGGFVNTELRELKDPRVFQFFNAITLDDGERPILSFLKNQTDRTKWVRTFALEGSRVTFYNSSEKDISQNEVGTPTYQGEKARINSKQYLQLFEMLNPMHRIWSDGRWNKLTLAHGCYWHQCSFCDVSLDYIARFEQTEMNCLVERIESLIRETGQRGFHFVDEAAPPKVLKLLAEKLIEKNITITWWGNIRFEKTFTPELCALLAQSGCVAVSGGLEVASDRLLKMMKKGVSVEQVARVTQAFSSNGILVHAYLMYGFPTQNAQDTIDSLERVRQLLFNGCIQSGYWHRFSVTAHSPIGKNPQAFGIRLLPEPPVSFARNDLAFEDPTGCPHEEFSEGLRVALYNYMHGAGYDLPLQHWFNFKVPSTQVDPELIQKALECL